MSRLVKSYSSLERSSLLYDLDVHASTKDRPRAKHDPFGLAYSSSRRQSRDETPNAEVHNTSSRRKIEKKPAEEGRQKSKYVDSRS